MTPCEHCGRETPDAAFCTWCGAQRSTPFAGEAKSRRKDYAASSGEHVSQPNVITTLLPHLPRHRVHEFRWGLIGGIAVVVALVLGGLVVAAILAAAILVPALYLVYLYEAQVYRDEPARVLALTLAAGIIIGVVLSIIGKLIWPLHAIGTTGAGFVLGACIIWPIVQEVVKPLPLVLLRGMSQFAETIDGLTFGVAIGLGFAGAETIVNFSQVITTTPVHTTSGNWLAEVLSFTVLVPLMQGSCTGIIAAVLWRPGRVARPLFAIGLLVAIGGHVLFAAISQVLLNSNVSWYGVLFFQAAVIAVILVYIRHLVHISLLEEAVDFGFQVVTCPQCRHTVGAAGFCPLCGGAISAGPRTAAMASSSTAPTTDPGPPTPEAGPLTTGGASA